MKNLFKTFALTLLAAATFSSCEQDPCKDVVCGDQGQCVEGTCVCNANYEQDAAGLCNTLQRTKFLTVAANGDITSATYSVQDQCSLSGTPTYSCIVTAHPTDMSALNIADFWDDAFVASVVATVSGSTLTIARQEPDSDGYFVEGSGSISNGTITFSYTITDERDPAAIRTDACTNSTWVK
jgi:hypothetical protein